ncbi:hypothetical protein M0805_009839 [Coniferiporia weirii]|nr:hypothetical protein M0805_009839 [Coniferiporia weirii]
MPPAERPAPDAAFLVDVVAGPARAVQHDGSTPPSSGHLSDGGRSLTRRSRVRRKNSHRDDSSSSDLLSTSGDISSGQLFVKIPSPDGLSGLSPKSGGTLESGVPPRPERSPWRPQPSPNLESFPTNSELHRTRPRTLSSSAATSRLMLDEERGRETCSENGWHGRGQRPRVLSLPRHAFRTGSLSDSSEQPSPLTPNAFNDIPPMPVFARNRRYRHQARDSGATQQSTASSSLYPKSTSTEDYLSPPSLPPNDIDDRLVITVDPEDSPHIHELHEMDADDVSYRLRLLMQNNYYLPPAHSKPFSEYSSSETPKKSSKSSSPTFFDIFKVGKKKSAVPDQKVNPTPVPILRTTSDSSTLSGLIRPQRHNHSAQHLHANAPQLHQEGKKGRVVVVRERMEDIRVVAKQVELDLKVREAERRKKGSESSRSEGKLDCLVDPTDSVDLPPVSANTFFGPQASLLNGMGIEKPIGAALLADRLPPSSPGIWSVDTEDEAWRKAILHAAVGHSLNNSPAATPTRSRSGCSPFRVLEISTSPSPAPFALDLSSPSTSSPLASPPLVHSAITSGDASASATLATYQTDGANSYGNARKRELGQRILTRMIDEADMGIADLPRPVSGTLSAVDTDNESRPSGSTEKGRSLRVLASGNYVPIRASSPTVPTTPLLPPPRRPNTFLASIDNTPVNAGHDQADGNTFVSGAGHLTVAQDDVTSRLSDVYESHVGLVNTFGELSPSGSQHNSATLSAVRGVQHGSVTISESITSGSHYSDDDPDDSEFHTPKEHTLASTSASSRPSLSVMTIPRVSSEYSQPSPTTSVFRDAFDHRPSMESSPVHSVVNTLGAGSHAPSCVSEFDDARYAAVSPPPRVSSSLAHAVLPPPPRSRRAILTSVPCGEEEEPSTPTNQAHGVMNLAVYGLSVPNTQLGSYPASPISFFDAVEMQSRELMEEEEEEEGEEGGEGEEGEEDEDEREDSCTEDEGSSEDECESTADVVDEYQRDSAGTDIPSPHPSSACSTSPDPRQPPVVFTRFGNSSLPQLTSGTSGARLSLGNKSQRGAPPVSWSNDQAKLSGLSSDAPRVSESAFDGLKHETPVSPSRGAKRPQTAGSKVGQRPWTGTKQEQSDEVWQDEQVRQGQSMRRLDGMLIEHMEREKEVLRRITTSLSKTSS